MPMPLMWDSSNVNATNPNDLMNASAEIDGNSMGPTAHVPGRFFLGSPQYF